MRNGNEKQKQKVISTTSGYSFIVCFYTTTVIQEAFKLVIIQWTILLANFFVQI